MGIEFGKVDAAHKLTHPEFGNNSPSFGRVSLDSPQDEYCGPQRAGKSNFIFGGFEFLLGGAALLGIGALIAKYCPGVKNRPIADGILWAPRQFKKLLYLGFDNLRSVITGRATHKEIAAFMEAHKRYPKEGVQQRYIQFIQGKLARGEAVKGETLARLHPENLSGFMQARSTRKTEFIAAKLKKHTEALANASAEARPKLEATIKRQTEFIAGHKNSVIDYAELAYREKHRAESVLRQKLADLTSQKTGLTGDALKKCEAQIKTLEGQVKTAETATSKALGNAEAMFKQHKPANLLPTDNAKLPADWFHYDGKRLRALSVPPVADKPGIVTTQTARDLLEGIRKATPDQTEIIDYIAGLIHKYGSGDAIPLEALTF